MFRRVPLLLALALLVGGCDEAGEPRTSTEPRKPTRSAQVPVDGGVSGIEGIWTGRLEGAERPPRLALRPDGGVEGFDGCNGFSGLRWDVEGAVVTLSGERLSTLVACPTLDVWLDRAVALRVGRTGLTALASDGRKLGMLTREGG